MMESIKSLVLLQGKHALQKPCTEAAAASKMLEKLCKAARETKVKRMKKSILASIQMPSSNTISFHVCNPFSLRGIKQPKLLL